MAKAKTLDEAVDEIFKKYDEAIKIAATEATQKAKEDLLTKAVSCLVQYYDDYTPHVWKNNSGYIYGYVRTYSLMDSFVPYANPVKKKNGGYICVAGVEFDPNKIANTYNGSEIYTPTDAEWIISNFLSGIHPRTNGSTAVGGGNYEYEAYYGQFVPAEEMNRYINNYRETFYDNLYFSFSKQVLKLTAK